MQELPEKTVINCGDGAQTREGQRREVPRRKAACRENAGPEETAVAKSFPAIIAIHPIIRLIRTGPTMVFIMRLPRAAILDFSTYVFPIVATPLLIWIWWRMAAGEWRLVALVFFVPVVFGYLTILIASRYAKRWRMTGPWRIGGAYVHHGFIYASKLSFVLLLATRNPSAVRTWIDLTSVALLAGAATAFGGWLHDLHAIRAGRIEMIGLDAGAAEESLASFAPISYFSVGATYAVVTIVGWQYVAADPDKFIFVFAAALAILLIGPAIVTMRTAR